MYGGGRSSAREKEEGEGEGWIVSSREKSRPQPRPRAPSGGPTGTGTGTDKGEMSAAGDDNDNNPAGSDVGPDGDVGGGIASGSDDGNNNRERELDDLWCRAFRSALRCVDENARPTLTRPRPRPRHRRWWRRLLCAARGTAGEETGLGLSPALVRGLLLGPDEDEDDDEDDGSSMGVGRDCIVVADDPRSVYLVGVPRRPLYRELARRLRHLSAALDADPGGGGGGGDHNDGSGGGGASSMPSVDRFLLDASHLGMSELPPAAPMPPPPAQAPTEEPETEASLAADDASAWLRLAGDDGVLRILGLRSTVGTLKVGGKEA